MIKTHPLQSCRAVAAFAAAAVLSIAASASAQTLNTNVFGGTNPVTDHLTVASTVGVNQQTIGALGPGFDGLVSLPVGVNTSLTETINANNNASLVLSETGIGAGALGTFSATKTFVGTAFVPSQFYQFTLTRTAASAVNLLSNTYIQLTTVDPATNTSTTVVDTSTGTGLLGVVNLLNLFGTSTTATFTFQAPANVDTTLPITFTIGGNVPASALNSTFTFTNGALVAVPEPGTCAALSVGIFGLALARARRRLL